MGGKPNHGSHESKRYATHLHTFYWPCVWFLHYEVHVLNLVDMV